VSQDRDPAADRDRVEQLLDEVVALPGAEQEAAFGALLAQHPDHANELRARYALFQRLAALAPDDGPNDGPNAAPNHGAGHGQHDGKGPARRQQFGEYELVRELGRGGMGIVYLARQRRGDQERLVALKVVLDRGAFSAQARERLRREGAAAFRLDHPGICQALDLGEVEGTPFLTMRYVPGATLAQRIAAAREAGGPLVLPNEASSEAGYATSSGAFGVGGAVRAAVAIVEQVARALHVAHEAGFVHRDVKPGNIMVTPEGQAVLLDFGLVRDEQSDAGLTLSGQPIGTPAYMSPEQIEPRGRRVDRTTDVYSLGVTLYELLALRQPFEGRTREALFRDILMRRADNVRKHVPAVSRDLSIVLAVAMDPEPVRRYATALEFADDLRRARMAQPILARPVSVARRLHLWSRRNPLASAVLVLLVVAVALNVGFASIAQRRAHEAEEARARAVQDFAAARDAVGELVELGTTHLADVPWLEPVRRGLLLRALAFHRGFLARAGVTPEVRREVAITKVECAGVLSHLGDAKAAAALLGEAIPELDALAAAAAAGDEERVWLARARLTSAQIAVGRGDAEAAAAEFRAVIETLQGILARRSLSVFEAVTLSTSLRNLAGSLQDRGELAEAAARIEAGLAIPAVDDLAFRLERNRLLGQRARLRRAQMDLEGAANDLRTAEQDMRLLLAGQPHDRDIRSSLALNRLAFGVLQASRDQVEDAAVAYTEARTLFEKLVATFPLATTDRSNLATVLGAEASLLLRQGEATDTSQLQRAVELMEEMVAQDPGLLGNQERLAQTRYRLAQAIRREDPARAAEQYRAALVGLEACLVADPLDSSARDLAWRSANSLGALFANRAQDEQARQAWATARLHGIELLRRSPDDARWRRGQATLLYNEGTLSCETGDLEAAATRLSEALELDAQLVADAPQDLRARAEYCKHLLRAAQVATLRQEGARAAWQRAAAVVEQTFADARQRLESNADARLDLASIARGVGASAAAEQEWAVAVPALERAEQLLFGQADNVMSQTERLLLDLASMQRWQAQGRRLEAEAASRSFAARVEAVVPLLAKSRLHSARVRACLGELDALVADGLPGLDVATATLRKAVANAR
jgi:serine/threonine protein kinase